MTQKKRDGKRKNRNERFGKKPDLGYYTIIVNTEDTEKYYFKGFRDSLPPGLRRRMSIVVKEAKTINMIETCKNEVAYDTQNREGWIVFDRDQMADFDKMIIDAKAEGISVGWSNPCFEIWLYAYYGEMPVMRNTMPENASQECCRRFGEIYERNKHIQYSKSESALYSHLIQTGNEENAIRIAQRRYDQCKIDYKNPSEMNSCTTVFKLISQIRDKVY